MAGGDAPKDRSARLASPAIDDTDPAVADTMSSEPGHSAGISASASSSLSRGPRQVRAGDTLGRYELGDELGEGGMATVFRARDTELRRDVAVKVLFPHLARRPDVVRRFHREARAAAGLEHPNILRIYDVGGAEGDDPPFMVMEMIRGRTLLEEIEQRGPMFAELVACVGALLADALAAAHAAGIVHRDVKPANVLIAANGRLLLADFGVARLETEDSLVTKTGALLGTPAYMSPEQATGDIATAKSDLYSLGVTLYQLATGALPYAGSTAKIMVQIATGSFVPPVKRRAAVGPELSRVIEQLLQTEPEARTASAAIVAGELRALAVASGFGDPADELGAYFADPDGFIRARTPMVVRTLVTAAEAALAEAKLPRAIALADRASALAPEDPRVGALIEKLAEGGRASRRRKLVATSALGLLLVGGGAGVAFTLLDREPAVAASDAGLAPGLDAGAPLADALAPDGLADAVPADATQVVIVDAGVVDAGARVRVDAGPTRRIDAGPVVPLATDARMPAPPIDAAVSAPTIDAAPAPAMGAIIVKSDAWCDVEIDGVKHGRWSSTPIRVAAGRHTVSCSQGTGTNRSWTQTVEVAAGATRTVTGALLDTLEVTVGTAGSATIDGRSYRPGARVQVKRGSVRVVSGGVSVFVSFSVPCELRDQPRLDCYR